jgi:hypothetical protein
MNKFKTPIVYLDFDETLVRTTQLVSQLHEWALRKYRKNISDSRNVINMVKNDEAKYQDEMMTDLKELNPIVFDHASIKYISLLRPHVFDFISELSEYKVAILTAGKKEFQQNIAVKQNLPIHEIYGKFEYNQIPKSKNCILVDDLDINTVGVNSKLKAMGIESPEDSSASNHHVKVNPWFGNKIDNGLLDSIEEIKNKIAIVGRQS